MFLSNTFKPALSKIPGVALLQFFAVFLLSLTSGSSAALVTQVSFDSGTILFKNADGTTNLTGGGAGDGNGAVIQLGYFTGAFTGTPTSNFTGTWVPLTGEGSANIGGSISGSSPVETFNKTSMGDNGGGNGEFGITVRFNSDVAGTFNDLPPVPVPMRDIPLSIRIYNNTTIASSTFYNTVSNDAWLWKFPAVPSPIPPTVIMSLGSNVNAAALKWESINVAGLAGTSGRTSIAVIPEPASAALMLIGLASLTLRRRVER